MTDMTGFKHGVNLGGWLSQCNHTKERYDTFITEKDFETIKSWGLDHVRIPVDYNLVETEAGEYKEDGFAYINNAFEWCKKNGLNMVLDLHKTSGYSFDSGEKEVGFFDSPSLQERFYKLWEQFATRYGKYENMVCFELLNEVTDQSFSDRWNAIIKKCIERIRKIAPTVRILVGGYWNNSVDAVKDLELPYDSNVIYNFHCYEPLIFTHQAAGWLPMMDKNLHISADAPYSLIATETKRNLGDVNSCYLRFDQKDSLSPEYFEKLMENMLSVAKERNVTLYCGEYGVIDNADAESALKWYQMLTSVLDKYDIGKAAWSYKSMNFGISDPWMDSVRKDLLKIM